MDNVGCGRRWEGGMEGSAGVDKGRAAAGLVAEIINRRRNNVILLP